MVRKMHNIKYRCTDIESVTDNPIHDKVRGNICYLAYLNEGERGWFLCESDNMFEPIHRIHTSTVREIQYARGGQVTVFTRNTKYVFKNVAFEDKEVEADE